jgi:hypothetical protein
MRTFTLTLTAAAALALGGVAAAGSMTPVFGARLSGMGDHGIVNFHSYASKHRLCWAFDLMVHGATGATIRDANGMVVAKLGNGYHARSCATVKANALALIESHPARYRVWVGTKGHPGDVRGKLVRGMVHM